MSLPTPAGTLLLLDVSDLPAPEPFERAVAALDALRPGEALHFRHRMRPRLLYPLLAERGYLEVTRSPREGEVHLLIWRAGDAPAESAARAALDELPP